MPQVALTCVLLVCLTTFLHYETMRLISFEAPRIPVPERLKVMVVVLALMLAHCLQILLYGVAIYGLVAWFDLGALHGAGTHLWISSLYFSGETFSSLGFGDLTPTGPIRLIAGIEALNGLLLIGWSASFMYIAMQRFWSPERAGKAQRQP